MTFPDINFGLLAPPLSFIGGVMIQSASLLREKPSRWQVIVFLGMLGYLVFLMSYAMSHAPSGEADITPRIISLVMTSGGIFAVLFIMIFLKSIVSVIDESVIISNTISFWFILFESWRDFSAPALVIMAVAGIVFGAASFNLTFRRGKIRKAYKYALYGWYLVVNGMFAVSYFKSLSVGFYELPASVNSGDVPALTMTIIGMIAVHVFFNFGILYYSVIYSLVSSETRRGLVEYSDRLFSDRQVSIPAVRRMLVVQVVSFLAVRIFLSDISGRFIALWMLMTPIIARLFARTGAMAHGALPRQ